MLVKSELCIKVYIVYILYSVTNWEEAGTIWKVVFLLIDCIWEVFLSFFSAKQCFENRSSKENLVEFVLLFSPIEFNQTRTALTLTPPLPTTLL